ncbi:hypothetical protein CRYUN_Cryun06bG0121300 [Craigia yunnanensis]
MNVSSVRKLCIHLISSAFQRCRLSEDLCRLSVVLKSFLTTPPIIRVSISGTGIGSCLEEFQDLYSREGIGTEKWDGLLSVKTTSICDNEIYHYQLNLTKSVSARRLTRLPSNPKNGVKFSGTEVCLSISYTIDALLTEINRFVQKSVAAELVIEHGDAPGLRCENVFLTNECNPLHFSTSNVERLKSGLEEYVLKHGNSLNNKCDSCFSSREQLRIGSGVACSMESHRSSGLTMEAVIVISEYSESPCFSYKLQICSDAPDLASTIAGIILSSNDSDFQSECISLLGLLQSQEIGGETIKDCIKEKIISVIETNDRKPGTSKDVAPFLFEDDCPQDPYFEEYEEGEDLFSSPD